MKYPNDISSSDTCTYFTFYSQLPDLNVERLKVMGLFPIRESQQAWKRNKGKFTGLKYYFPFKENCRLKKIELHDPTTYLEEHFKFLNVILIPTDSGDACPTGFRYLGADCWRCNEPTSGTWAAHRWCTCQLARQVKVRHIIVIIQKLLKLIPHLHNAKIISLWLIWNDLFQWS